MDLKHKLKDLVMSEFAYDLSKYEDEGEAKVNNVAENLGKLFSLTDVSQHRELLIAFLEMNNWFSLEDRKNAEGVVDCYLKAINCGQCCKGVCEVCNNDQVFETEY